MLSIDSGLHIIEVHTPKAPELNITGLLHPVTRRAVLFADSSTKELFDRTERTHFMRGEYQQSLPYAAFRSMPRKSKVEPDTQLVLGYDVKPGMYHLADVPMDDDMAKETIIDLLRLRHVADPITVSITPFQKRHENETACSECGASYSDKACPRCAHICMRRHLRWYQFFVLMVGFFVVMELLKFTYQWVHNGFGIN